MGFASPEQCPGCTNWHLDLPGLLSHFSVMRILWSSCVTRQLGISWILGGVLKQLCPSTDSISSRLFSRNWSLIPRSHKRAQLTEPADTPSAAIHLAGAVCLSDLFVAVSHSRHLVQLQFLTGTFQERMMNLHSDLYGSSCWGFAQHEGQSSSSWQHLLAAQLVYFFTGGFGGFLFVCLYCRFSSWS